MLHVEFELSTPIPSTKRKELATQLTSANIPQNFENKPLKNGNTRSDPKKMTLYLVFFPYFD